MSFRWLALIAVSLCVWCQAAIAGNAQTWPLRNGEEYFGAATSYDFATREVTIIKADGKSFSFPARELTYSGKRQLMDTAAFGSALKSYRPPFLPAALAVLSALILLSLPALAGLWASAHLFGATASAPGHLVGFLKVLAIALVQGGVWLLAAIFLDPGKPIVPDTNADIVMTLTVMVVGLLVASLVVALHYQRSFWKGMAITCLAGVFASIVATAMALAALFIMTQMDSETLVTRVVFEPFGVF